MANGFFEKIFGRSEKTEAEIYNLNAQIADLTAANATLTRQLEEARQARRHAEIDRDAERAQTAEAQKENLWYEAFSDFPAPVLRGRSSPTATGYLLPCDASSSASWPPPTT